MPTTDAQISCWPLLLEKVCAGHYGSRLITALPSFSLALAKLRGPSTPLLRATHSAAAIQTCLRAQSPICSTELQKRRARERCHPAKHWRRESRVERSTTFACKPVRAI